MKDITKLFDRKDLLKSNHLKVLLVICSRSQRKLSTSLSDISDLCKWSRTYSRNMVIKLLEYGLVERPGGKNSHTLIAKCSIELLDESLYCELDIKRDEDEASAAK